MDTPQDIQRVLQRARDLGLPLADAKKSAHTTADSPLESLEEVNAFVDSYWRLPCGGGEKEWHAFCAFKALHKLPDAEKTRLAPRDRHHVLEMPETEQEEELLAPSMMQSDIFTLQHIKAKPKAKPDSIAQRTPCKDFEQFRALFDVCATQMAEGVRRVRRFKKERDIHAGDFFILKGILAYVAEVKDRHMRGKKPNARLRVIFDNGTECEYLSRAFASELYKDPQGRRVLSPSPVFGSACEEDDAQTGTVYIVQSLSKDPQIRALEGQLYKIGITTGPVAQRIQGAEKDPTFLMAPAALVKTYTLYNIKRNAVERLLHAFFASARLDVMIPDRLGRDIEPREWFVVSLEAIDAAIACLKEGSIAAYIYDSNIGVVRRS